jgi:cell wall-associated NlpC family hydrolase
MFDRHETAAEAPIVGLLKLTGCAAVAAVPMLWGLAPAAGAHAAGVQTAGARAGAPAATVTAFVDVAVATVWTSPTSPRSKIDAPAVSNPVNMAQWLANMNTSQRRWLTTANATQTQAIYGRPVYILATQPGWDEVAVPGQPTPKNSLGYPGWIPAGQLVQNATFASEQAQPFAQVNAAPQAWLYNDAQMTQPFMQVSVSTRLPELGQDPTTSAIEVDTPAEGPKWLCPASAAIYRSTSAIPVPTGADLVATAQMFLGVDYLWAGRSGWMFDCSGLTGVIYEAWGIAIPRDADAQALDGGATRVATQADQTTANLQPGDIMFYATGGTGSIYHDALYAGNGQMIEAYGAGVPVRITPVRFGTDYWGAVRYLQ